MRPAKRFKPGQIAILSTDLRDGSQTPGVNFDLAARISIGEALAEARVDLIEAGFPISCELHDRSVRGIVDSVGHIYDAPVIAGFARTGRMGQGGQLKAPDIDAAWDAIRGARYPRIHIVGSGSDLHLREKYRSEGAQGRSRSSNMAVVAQSISYAADLMRRDGFEADVEFSPEDCGRSELSYLIGLFAVAIRAGATVLNVPDTVGRMRPDQYSMLMAALIANVPGAERVTWSAHTHDDLGLATANTMAGIQAGARQVEGTFLGLGERAGNTCLEQIATILALHDSDDVRYFTNLRLDLVPALCQQIADLAKVAIPASAPIIGRNAFRHKSGMHQDGVLKKPEVYQDIPPALVGRKIELELGPDSGWAGVSYCADRLGYNIPATHKSRVMKAFQSLAGRIGLVEDDDLVALLDDEVGTAVIHKRPRARSRQKQAG